jgi:hypothetical protein
MTRSEVFCLGHGLIKKLFKATSFVIIPPIRGGFATIEREFIPLIGQRFRIRCITDTTDGVSSVSQTVYHRHQFQSYCFINTFLLRNTILLQVAADISKTCSEGQVLHRPIITIFLATIHKRGR